MLAELLTVLSLSINGFSISNKDNFDMVTRDSPCSFSISNQEENISVCYGRELFYYDKGEYKDFPNSFNESDSSYFVSIPNSSVIIKKDHLNFLKINNEFVVFNSRFVSIDNYLLNGPYVKRIDTIYNDDDLKSFGFLYMHHNVNIEILDSCERLLCSKECESFSGFDFLSGLCPSSRSYPLNITTSIYYVGNSINSRISSPYLREKYFEVGQNDSIENTSLLKVGISELAAYGPNGEYFPEYKTAFEVTLPTFADIVNHYVNISLKAKKSSGFLNGIKVYRANNVSFNDLNGMTSYTRTYLGNMILSNGYFSLDYRFVTNCISSNNEKLVLVLESGVTYSSTANLYSSETSNPVMLSREHHSVYGNASFYNFASGGLINCYGYVINGGNTSLSFNNGGNLNTEAGVIQGIIGDLQNNHGYNARHLNSSSDYIFANERRIVAYVSNTTTAFHFMKQCSDGRWAHKFGPSDSQCFNYGVSPEDINDQEWNLYQYQNLFFAIS